MKQTFIYTGAGAYQARDVEDCLSVFDVDYRRLTEHDLRQLVSDGIFIVPGGQVATYLPSWKPEGISVIRTFVHDGGTYLGICAGAYVAGSTFQKQPGLAFFDSELVHSLHEELVTVNDSHSVQYQLIGENGPDLSGITHAEPVLIDQSGKPRVITLRYGNGTVILFAAHPEGSVYHRKDPRDFSAARFFVNLLRNT